MKGRNRRFGDRAIRPKPTPIPIQTKATCLQTVVRSQLTFYLFIFHFMDNSFGIIGFLTPVFIYFFYSYCQYLLATKLGQPKAWFAFVPILGLILALRQASMSAWWILGLFIPLLNIYIIVRMMHQGISLRTGHRAGWTVGLVLLYMIFFPITAFTYTSSTNC